MNLSEESEFHLKRKQSSQEDLQSLKLSHYYSILILYTILSIIAVFAFMLERFF